MLVSLSLVGTVNLESHTTRIARDYVNTTQFNGTGDPAFVSHGNMTFDKGNFICLDASCNCYVYENLTGYIIMECT
ncbi:MAG: hypothetical protein KAX49_16620 [Halanaerobiales bacterium]|nr:hypothetical protein [Halanaerobiales bacterium]